MDSDSNDSIDSDTEIDYIYDIAYKASEKFSVSIYDLLVLIDSKLYQSKYFLNIQEDMFDCVTYITSLENSNDVKKLLSGLSQITLNI